MKPEQLREGAALLAAATPGPWRQGTTLATQQTKRWSDADIRKNDAVEHRHVYARFTESDQGRARKIVCECDAPDAAAIAWLRTHAAKLLADSARLQDALAWANTPRRVWPPSWLDAASPSASGADEP